ncbi:YheC/YheD family endospore coat-associated protein [Bacillus sp. FJAT-45350]|uniref:YheC/YheD family endospore coat-associated protein n=1 Tax=Bacillus sp. FJAT-45350 TaxID=2011014 RepID=UPI0015CC7003|nr:YheC/YheD family protein [Bacillus sp. FJAT-45350]
MLSLGILSLDENQESHYYKELAIKGKQFFYEVVLFHPADVNFESNTIKGRVYNQQKRQWEKQRCTFPTFIYDRCFYPTNTQYKEYKTTIKQLRSRIPFIGYGLPDKWSIHETLIKQPTLTSFIPNTIHFTSAKDILPLIQEQGEVVVKPASGSQGRGIFFIRYKKEQIEVRTQVGESIISRRSKDFSRFISWLNNLIEEYTYLCQPSLSLRTSKNEPFDFRIFLQKDGDGQWQELGRAVRKGEKEKLISNLHGGASSMDFFKWIQDYSIDTQKAICNQICNLINDIPPILESTYGPLFELGLDVALDQDYKLWLLEVNSKPGRSILLSSPNFENEKLYRAPFEYITFLSRNLNEDNKNLVYYK